MIRDTATAAGNQNEDIAETISSIDAIVKELEAEMENSPVAHVNINVPEEISALERY